MLSMHECLPKLCLLRLDFGKQDCSNRQFKITRRSGSDALENFLVLRADRTPKQSNAFEVESEANRNENASELHHEPHERNRERLADETIFERLLIEKLFSNGCKILSQFRRAENSLANFLGFYSRGAKGKHCKSFFMSLSTETKARPFVTFHGLRMRREFFPMAASGAKLFPCFCQAGDAPGKSEEKIS